MLSAISKSLQLSGTVSTVAGSETSGFQDGTGADAQFNSPMGVAIGGDGCLFVADTENHRIRKIKADGTVSTVAGSGAEGFQDGAGADAQFYRPWGVAIDGDGCLFVADNGNNRIRKVEPGGTVSTVAGSGTEGFRDGTGADAQFNDPTGVAIDGNGCLVVADSNNDRVRKVEPGGTVSSKMLAKTAARAAGNTHLSAPPRATVEAAAAAGGGGGGGGGRSYTLAELQRPPYPDGVDPAAREELLCDEDFVATFGMDMAAFKALPKWKRVAAKKKHGLF